MKSKIFSLSVAFVLMLCLFISSPLEVGAATANLAKPKLVSASSVYKGVLFKWDSVKGAEKYRVFRNEGAGWKKVVDTTATSCTDSKVVSGKSYTYTVRCIDASGKNYRSGYDAKGLTIKYVATPKFSALTNTAAGVKLSWSKVNGASQYRIFYKDGSSWQTVTTTSSTSYLDKDLSSGESRTYTIRCIDDNGKYCSGFSGTGWTQTYVSVPEAKAELAVNGVKLTWGKVNGASQYIIFYMKGSSWATLTTTSSTSYLDKSVPSGSTRTYTVRCLNDKGKYCSAYNSTGWKIKYVAAPKVSTVREVNGAVSVFWNAIPNVSKYRVYAKSNDGKYEPLGYTAATVFMHYDAEPNTEYFYTVRCASDDGKNISAYYGSNNNALIKTAADSLKDKTKTIEVELSTNKNDAYANKDELQNALNEESNSYKLTVKIKTKGTYYVGSTGGALIIRSNTTFDLNGSTLIRYGDMNNLVQNAAVGINSYPKDGKGYSMTKNFTICNGSLDGQDNPQNCNLVNIGHADGIRFININFKCKDGHLIEITGVKDCIMKNCTFTGFYGDASMDDNEAVQIDIPITGWNGVYYGDATVCQNIVVDGCEFKDYPSGVGNHHTLKGKHNSNITIINNKFTNSKKTNQYAIRCYGFDNSTVSGNTVTGNYTNGIRVSGGNVDVTCNTLTSKNCKPIYVTSSSSHTTGSTGARVDEYASKCKINNNYITSTGENDGLSIFGSSGVNEVSGNFIRANGNAMAIVISSNVSAGAINNNNLYSAYSNGIFIAKNSTVKSINGNKVRGYSEAIFVSSNSNVKSISNNPRITSIKESGIYVTAGARATTINGNVVSNCGDCGILVSSSGITSTINSNKISKCKEYGIRVNNSSLTITVLYNTFSGNGSGSLKINASGKIQAK